MYNRDGVEIYLGSNHGNLSVFNDVFAFFLHRDSTYLACQHIPSRDHPKLWT